MKEENPTKQKAKLDFSDRQTPLYERECTFSQESCAPFQHWLSVYLRNNNISVEILPFKKLGKMRCWEAGWSGKKAAE